MNSGTLLNPTDLPERFPRFRPAEGSLASQARALLTEQKESWADLNAGYASLISVRTREVRCDGYKVVLQFNPGRMASTSAPVDPESVRARPCFLCFENLPMAQRGILYEDEFVLLCNPSPIFSHHYTIAHVIHRPQAIESAFSQFLGLARALSPDFTVFYNGPRCGASAPDHLHFQASPFRAIPIEREVVESTRRMRMGSFEGVWVFTLNNLDREAFVLEGGDQKNIERVFFRLAAAMRKTSGTADEPLMNVLSSFDGTAWRVILFPRSKHRPDAFFLKGDDRIVVSPAAVDIGGLVVTPLEKDFLNLDAPTLLEIFKEVSVDRGYTARMLKAFKQ